MLRSGDRWLRSRKGSVYVEASLVMPAAVIIAAALISLSMYFYSDICAQVRQHEKELSERPQGYESSYVRKADMIEREFDEYIESKLEQ